MHENARRYKRSVLHGDVRYFFYIDMQVRRKIFNKISSDKEFAKALALCLYIKSIFRSSAISNFTYNKLHKLTGLHITTLKKRVSKLRELGFAKFVGKNNTLVICSVKSKCEYRNVNIGDFENVKDVEKSLYAHILVEIQKRKEFVKQLLRLRSNPNKNELEEHKRAKKNAVKFGYDKVNEYKDNGISYKTIAEKMGVSIQKAYNTIRWAVERNIIIKNKNQQQFQLKGYKPAYFEYCDYTFYTNSNIYKIYANTYSLPCAGTY